MHTQNNSKNFIWRYAARLLACVVFGIILVVHFSVLVHAEGRSVDFTGYTLWWNGASTKEYETMTVSGVTGSLSCYTLFVPHPGSNILIYQVVVSNEYFNGSTYSSEYGFYYRTLVDKTSSQYYLPANVEWHLDNAYNKREFTSNSTGNALKNEMLQYIADNAKLNSDHLDVGEWEDTFDFNMDHNFSADVYQTEIPTPELSNLGYDGFTVNNAADDLYLDMYVTSVFYGVKHGSKDNDDWYDVDKSNIVGSHRYNMTNYDLAYNYSTVTISTMYSGVDTVGDLVSDFERWSSSYPSHKNLSDYSFIKHGSSNWETAYSHHHIQTTDRKEYEMRRSKQAYITYYVRFYQYVDNELKYGKWVSYTYNYVSQDIRNLEIGDVAASSNGEPYSTNTYQGVQDSEGNFTYGAYTGNSQSIGTVEVGSTTQSMIDVLKELPSLAYYYTNFSQFLVATFAFIPAIIWMLIVNAFRLSLVVLLYKYVRGM